jgi:hypothetical protein
MGIDLSSVDWTFVGLMTALAFVASLIGGIIAFRNRLLGSIFAAILFAVGFVAWNYYPHSFGLPILKATGPDGIGAAPATTPSAGTAPMNASPMAPATPPATPMAPATPPSGMAPTSPMAPATPASPMAPTPGGAAH